MMMAVLPPLGSENSDSEEELEVPIPKIDTTHLSELDCDSNSDTSSAPTVRDLEEIINNKDDLPIYDDAGINLDSYNLVIFTQNRIFYKAMTFFN